MSISGIGGHGVFDPSKFASRVMKDLDTNGDGSIDKSEFTTGLAKKGVTASDASKQFDKIDISGKGKLTQSDIESSLKALGAKGQHPAGAPPNSGPPPGGGTPPRGGSKTGGAQKSGGSTNSSNSTNYDKRDANKDGVVSPEEKLTYNLKHPEEAINKESQNAGNYLDVTA